MLAYTLKKALQLIPEATEMVKAASIEEEFPVDSRDSCLASALALKYQEKIAHSVVDLFVMEKVAHAVEVYGLQNDLQDLTVKMIKAANQARTDAINNDPMVFHMKQANFQGELTGRPDFAVVTSTATALYKEAQERGLSPVDEVVLYSGHGFLNKEASVKALSNRFHKTKNTTFVKLARAIYELDEKTVKPETLVDIGMTVYNLDKEAGLSTKGHNFFTETMFAKEAAFASSLNVTLDGKAVPYERLLAVGEARIAAFMGKDIADEMKAGPAHFKQIVETLPRDLQRQLYTLTANV